MIIPPKLKQGDEIRIIAPSMSLSLVPKAEIERAKKNIEKQGFKVTFSKNCKEKDIFNSSSIQSRIDDLHKAFLDKNVKAIFAVSGGFNSNQLLKYIDFELIKKNPKIFCGYSDITALTNSITAKTKLITYSGRNFITWGLEKDFKYNIEYFNKCLIEEKEFKVKPSKTPIKHTLFNSKDFIILNKGKAKGKIFGGNLCTFNLLQGTEFMPDISDSILFIEDDDLVGEFFIKEFDRNLQSLIHQPNFEKVKGIVFGKFLKKTKVNINKLEQLIRTKKELKKIPIIANVDFGHSEIMITFPIGGTASLKVDDKVELKIIKH